MVKANFRQNIVKGTAKNDVLVGGVGVDRLVGGAGDDCLIAAWDDISNAPSGVLIYDGGQGTDTLDFSALDSPIGIDLYFDPYIYRNYDRSLHGEFIHYNPAPSDRISGAVSGVENLFGTEFSDYLQGSTGNNVIHGRAGDDYIASQRGTDTVIGGAGNDFIFFGSHFGTISGDNDLDPAATGNDIFQIGGNDAGIYAQHRQCLADHSALRVQQVRTTRARMRDREGIVRYRGQCSGCCTRRSVTALLTGPADGHSGIRALWELGATA